MGGPRTPELRPLAERAIVTIYHPYGWFKDVIWMVDPASDPATDTLNRETGQASPGKLDLFPSLGKLQP
jgi:hypothetical protein